MKFGILGLALPNGAINRFPSFLSLSSDHVKSSTSLNRRSFLRLAGGAAALPTILTSKVFGQNAPSNRLNVGFIGCGGITPGHRGFVLNNPALQMLWLCDVDSNRANDCKNNAEEVYSRKADSGTYKGVKTSGDFREVIADPDVDIVFVCTPDHWHALPVIAAAQAGKHIYTEKPLARTIEEGRAMVNAIKRAGITCQVGAQQRSGGEFQRAIALVRNGMLGKVQQIKVGLPGGGPPGEPVSAAPQEVPKELDYDFWLGPAPGVPYIKQRVHYQWRWNFDYAGGQVADWINHHYDIAQIAAGVNGQSPVAIRNASAEFTKSPIYTTATRYTFEVHYAGGEVIEVSSTNPGGITIIGEKGTVSVDRGRINYSTPELKNATLPSNGFVMWGGKNDHQNNFVESIKAHTAPRTPATDAYHTAVVAHLANAAFRAGISELLWDPVKERVTNSADAERFLTANYRGPWTLPA